MNSLYLKAEELSRPIPRTDYRYRHVTRILKKTAGDLVAACCSDGTVGSARIESIDDSGMRLAYEPGAPAPELRPVRLLLGFPRPIQAGRILKDLTTLGVSSIWLILTDTSEKSYAESDFFRKRDFESHLIEGAEQAGNPRLPCIRTFWSLDRALAEPEPRSVRSPSSTAPTFTTPLPAPDTGARIVLHVGGALPSLAQTPLGSSVSLAIGSERGWTERELSLFREHGFLCCSLGDRILKTETATVAAVSIVLARLGYM